MQLTENPFFYIFLKTEGKIYLLDRIDEIHSIPNDFERLSKFLDSKLGRPKSISPYITFSGYYISDRDRRVNEEEARDRLVRNYKEEERHPFISWKGGSWLVTVWDAQSQELILARDRLGHRSLYYFDNNNFFICCTNLKRLLKLGLIPKELNQDTLLQLGPGRHRDARTFFKGIKQVPKGHYLSVTKDGTTLTNYWYPKIEEEIQHSRHEDYVEHFNQIYSSVVNESLEGYNRPGIALSSGLDSGSIYVVAQDHLNKRSKSIQAITWRPDSIDAIYKDMKRVVDESSLAEKIVQGCSKTNLHIVTSRKGNLLELYKGIIDRCDQPIVNLQPHMMEVFGAASEIGVDVLLNGFLGNFTVSYPGKNSYRISNIRELLSVAQWIARKALRSVMKNADSPNVRNRNNDYIRSQAINDHLETYSPISAEMKDLRKKSLDQRKIHRNYPIIMTQFQSNFIQDISRYTQSLGYESRSILMDSRLVDFCLNIPNWVYNSNGTKKRLIKTSMNGRLPKEILHGSRRGLQGANYIGKFRYEKDSFKGLFAEFKKSKLTSYWLDEDLLHAHFDAFVDSKTTYKDLGQKANFNILNRGIQLGIFLLRIEDGYFQ